MTILYKLTDQNYQTFNGRQWGVGIERTASGEGGLCGPGWLHAYTHPVLAVFLYPIQANIPDLVLWEAEGDVGIEHNSLIVGCTRLKTIKIIPLPEITMEQRIRFGILCALEVYSEPGFVSWARRWLSGEDRSVEAARSAGAATWAAGAEAAGLATWAARAAEDASKSWKKIDLIALAEKATLPQVNVEE